MTSLRHDSAIMRLCRQVGLKSLAWKLRRLHCPVDTHALVLDVGSGGNPYPRANILLDAYVETGQRYWEPLIHDRPTAIGYGERLPFKDKSFDFVIASHCLEHSSEPQQFLGELQRVARAGYIETPDALMERLHPYPDHRCEVTIREGRLFIRKKEQWKPDSELFSLCENGTKDKILRSMLSHNPFAFHVRYYWQDRIDYVVVNPDVDSTWSASSSPPTTAPASAKRDWYVALRRFVSGLFSQQRRNSSITLLDLLACPACGSSGLEQKEGRIYCPECSAVYDVQHGMPMMVIELAQFDGRS